jgi:hypothetical protein
LERVSDKEYYVLGEVATGGRARRRTRPPDAEQARSGSANFAVFFQFIKVLAGIREKWGFTTGTDLISF